MPDAATTVSTPLGELRVTITGATTAYVTSDPSDIRRDGALKVRGHEYRVSAQVSYDVDAGRWAIHTYSDGGAYRQRESLTIQKPGDYGWQSWKAPTVERAIRNAVLDAVQSVTDADGGRAQAEAESRNAEQELDRAIAEQEKARVVLAAAETRVGQAQARARAAARGLAAFAAVQA